MQRIVVVRCARANRLVISPLIFGQSTPARPSRDRRLEEALTDIALLKRLVKEQDRRIADLEKAVTQSPSCGPSALPCEATPKVVPKPLAARWQNPLAWAQIQEGMSRAQVEDILGKADLGGCRHRLSDSEL